VGLSTQPIELPRSTSGRDALEVAAEAGRRAGDILRHQQHELKVAWDKTEGHVVTETDYLVEEAVVSYLRQEYPQWGIQAEESLQKAPDTEYLWIVDPLDGSRNFNLGIPHFCTSIALVRSGEVLLGLIHDPIREETFAARKGQGTTVNGRPMSVSPHATLAEAVLGFDMGYDDERAKRTLKLVLDLWPGMQSIRVMGSAALGLAYAACGRVDLYFHHYLFPWDLAAGILMVAEAGGVVTDRDGGPISLQSQGLIATNASLHAEFLAKSREQAG